MRESILHTGIVERVDTNRVIVRITQYSACAGCHAKSACTMSDKKEKQVEIEDASGDYHPGEAVVIIGQDSMGMEAVLWAFAVPVVLMLIAVVTGISSGWEETASGALGVLVLIPYYIVLYVLRDKLKKRFVFKLKKLKD